MKKTKRVLTILLVLALLATLMTGCKKKTEDSAESSASEVSSSRPAISIEPQISAVDVGEGKTTFKFEVTYEDGTTELYSIKTDEEFLKDALEKEGMIEGEETETGFFVTTVNGVKANEKRDEWWLLTKNRNLWAKGAAESPIEEGVKYEFSWRVG